MIRENYVSFETAKLLKEKGFDGQCYKVWAKESKSEPKLYAAPSFVEGDTTVDRESVEDGERFMNDLNPSEYKVEGYLAPTLQMAVQWIQEAYNILIVADYEDECTDTSWYCKVYRLGENGKPERVAITGTYYDYSGEHKQIVGYRDYERGGKEYATREEAEDDGIRYVLENYIS